MASTTHFDLVILGSGSTAFATALRAQEVHGRSQRAETDGTYPATAQANVARPPSRKIFT
jgi:pyruvate/2-oxoglutarate dehydrogenase complex dihydrolipoamide dehydrogenase (E3) component